jgi:hypothetical protein
MASLEKAVPNLWPGYEIGKKFKPVFPGVASSCDPNLSSLDLKRGEVVSGWYFCTVRMEDLLKNRRCFRPLKCHTNCRARLAAKVHLGGFFGFEKLQYLAMSRCVDDKKEIFCGNSVKKKIIDDTPLVVQKKGVVTLPILEFGRVVCEKGL